MTLEEFKKEILTEAQLLHYSEKEIELLYNAHITFANFVYKKWIEERYLGKKT